MSIVKKNKVWPSKSGRKHKSKTNNYTIEVSYSEKKNNKHLMVAHIHPLIYLFLFPKKGGAFEFLHNPFRLTKVKTDERPSLPANGRGKEKWKLFWKPLAEKLILLNTRQFSLGEVKENSTKKRREVGEKKCGGLTL